MANNITTTEAAVFIPEIWGKETLIERDNKLVLGKLVWRFNVSDGDTYHVPSLSNLEANDKIKNVDVQYQAPTETNTDILLNKHKYTAFVIEDMAAKQANRDLRAPYTKKAGEALARIIDQDLAALASGFSQTKGTYNTAVTTDVVLDSIQLLDEANAPEDDRHFVFRPVVKRDILDLSIYTSGDYISGKPVETGQIGNIYGVSTHMTMNIYQSGNNINNMLFHREALALAVQSDVTVHSEYSVDALGWKTVADEIYGVKEMRDDHGVLVKS